MTSLHPGETHAAAAPGGRDRRPLLVGCVAAALSFAGSWVPSLWTDEAATITAARRTLPQLWRMLGTVDAVHGAYYAFAHVWVALFGSTALALRLPSAVAVGLAAGALTVLVRRLGGTPALATGSGLVFAVLPRTTWMGVEGRSYAWTALLAVALTLTLVIAADAQGRRRTAPWVAYAVLGALCVVVHIYLVLLLLAHAVSVLPGRRPRRRRPVRRGGRRGRRPGLAGGGGRGGGARTAGWPGAGPGPVAQEPPGQPGLPR